LEDTKHIDHLATWNEVCDALMLSPLGAFAGARLREVCCEVAPDARDTVRVLSEEIAWQRLAREAMETWSN
jgi:hypothetical protein